MARVPRYELVTQDAANGYNDTICDNASNVGDDVRSLKDAISSMRGDVKTNTNPSVLTATSASSAATSPRCRRSIPRS